VKKKEKDKHQSYLMVVDEEDNNIGQMRMKMKKGDGMKKK
jgi:predicted regulator of Ras-like GTPase activity (Roadblock/LC7/MglB family)